MSVATLFDWVMVQKVNLTDTIMTKIFSQKLNHTVVIQCLKDIMKDNKLSAILNLTWEFRSGLLYRSSAGDAPALLARNSAAAKAQVVERFAFTTGQARAGREFIFPTPLSFSPRPSVQFQPREARQSVGVSFKIGSSFVQQLRQFATNFTFIKLWYNNEDIELKSKLIHGFYGK